MRPVTGFVESDGEQYTAFKTLVEAGWNTHLEADGFPLTTGALRQFVVVSR